MKHILAILILPIVLLLTGCETTSTDNLKIAARAGAQYYGAKDLQKAKTVEDWQWRKHQLIELAAVFRIANEGLSSAALRSLIASKMADDPEAMLIADLILAIVPPDMATRGINNEFLAAVVAGLEGAAAAPMPDLPNKEDRK